MADLFNINLEQAILGNLLINNNNIDKAVLAPEDFYDALHGRLFREINSLHNAGEKVSPLILWNIFRDDEDFISVGHIEYLAAISMASPSLPDVKQLSQKIRELRKRRDYFSLAERMAAIAGAGEFSNLIEDAERGLYALADAKRYGTNMMSFDDVVSISLAQAEVALSLGGKISGVSSGFREIDQIVGGLHNSDLIILAGRPGMGKTALATNIAFHASEFSPVMFFSLEMAAPQISARILSDVSGVEAWKVRRGRISPTEMEQYVLSGRDVSSRHLFIDDAGALTLPQLCARARRAKREHGISLIVIDYLQLLDGSRKQESRVQEVTEITKGLKALAKELDIPVLALSQLSRNVENRDDKRPQLSDLRESGSIEQDADIVMFVYREEYYVQSKEPDVSDPLYAKWQEKLERCHGRADVFVEKNRHGSTGRARLGFDATFTRFKNLDE